MMSNGNAALKNFDELVQRLRGELRTNVTLDEIFLKLVERNIQFTQNSNQQLNAEELQQEVHGGDRSPRDAQLSDDDLKLSLRLEEEPDNNFHINNEASEQNKEEGRQEGQSLSLLSFSKNEENNILKQKLEEMEKLNESLQEKIQSIQAENQCRLETLNKMTKHLLEDLKEVGVSMENDHVFSEIDNCEDATPEEKLIKMRFCVLKMNIEMRKLKQMSSNGVSLEHRPVANADRQDYENSIRAEETAKETLSPSPNEECTPKDNSSSPRKEPNKKRRIGDNLQEVGHSSGTENSKMTNPSGNRKRNMIQVQETAEPSVSTPPLKMVRTLCKRNRVSVNADSTAISIKIQTDDISDNEWTDRSGRRMELLNKNKSTKEFGRTKRQKNKSASGSDNNGSKDTKGCKRRYEICDKQAINLKRHLISLHTDLRPYKCPRCSKSFKNVSHRKRHIQEVHYPTRLYKCNQCCSSFKRNHSLKTHIQEVHYPTRLYKCNQCCFSFKRNHDRKIHIQGVHNPIRLFKCNECSSSYKRKQNLYAHTRRKHSEDRN